MSVHQHADDHDPRHHRVDPLRYETPLCGEKRRAAQQTCAELSASIAAIDAQLIALADDRRKLAQKLRQVHRRIHPNLGKRAGRQPARDGAEQLPPVRCDAIVLWGRRLRSVCLSLLRAAGTLSLIELHSLLHLHGYVIASRNHVKVLADALAYEVDQGRARRVARGVYEVLPGPAPAPGRHGNVALRETAPDGQ